MRKAFSGNSTGIKYQEFDSEIIPHMKVFKNFALKMTKEFQESEDLAQDTLLKAFSIL